VPIDLHEVVQLLVRYLSPVAVVSLLLARIGRRADRRALRRERLERVGELVVAVQNAAGEALVLPPRHVEESRRVMACRYALNNLRSVLAGTDAALPHCRALAAFDPVVPRTIEGNIWPMAGLARDEVDETLGVPPVGAAPWRRDAAA
jgi:hypothetical protein